MPLKKTDLICSAKCNVFLETLGFPLRLPKLNTDSNMEFDDKVVDFSYPTPSELISLDFKDLELPNVAHMTNTNFTVNFV